MDTLTSDLNPPLPRKPSREVIGWWCLVDTDEVWEWGRAILSNVYDQPFHARLDKPLAFLQQPANQ